MFFLIDDGFSCFSTERWIVAFAANNYWFLAFQNQRPWKSMERILDFSELLFRFLTGNVDITMENEFEITG